VLIFLLLVGGVVIHPLIHGREGYAHRSLGPVEEGSKALSSMSGRRGPQICTDVLVATDRFLCRQSGHLQWARTCTCTRRWISDLRQIIVGQGIEKDVAIAVDHSTTIIFVAMKDVISAVDKFISFFCATCYSADVIEVLALLVHGFRRIATIATVDVVHGVVL